jgi:2-polyprenyl-3-methyl-5-hydroxy-6-metoxy-1,4-benzoquinol methylase
MTKLEWQKFYETGEGKKINDSKLPWVIPTLDETLSNALSELNLNSGSFLNVGTGLGSQAFGLKQLGFTVTATDISEDAINKAKQLYPNVNFIVDDILSTTLTEQFDYVLDRLTLIHINEDDRSLYFNNIKSLIKPGGLFFLICLDKDQVLAPHNDMGKFSQDELDSFMGSGFTRTRSESYILSIEGKPMTHTLKRIFCIYRKI